jgi:hypothetical protein
MAKIHSVSIIVGDKEIPANLRIESWGFVTRSGLKPPTEYRWEEFKVFSVEGPEQLQKRVTVTRLLAIGIFAFAKKKSSGESFLFAETNSSATLIIKFLKKSEPEVKALFAPFRNNLPNENASPMPTNNDIASQIEKLVELHSKGALTDEEFSSMKAKILG